MKSLVHTIVGTSCLVGATLISSPSFAENPEIAFLPPPISVTDVCIAAPAEPKEDDLETGTEDDYLTNNQRIRFLNRDIRRLKNEDADKWFDFIGSLLTRLHQVDDRMTELDLWMERIELYIAANRLDELEQSGLINQVLTQKEEMSAGQLLTLAHYYLSGTGVAQDNQTGQELIHLSALAGNPDALFELAELQIAGELIQSWNAPLDLTITMAMVGILGEMDRGVCRRAERIAEIFRIGKVVAANQEMAMAWTQFAADLGSASAAWRIVEHHMNADDASKDNDEMLHYLQLAVERGIGIEAEQAEQLKVAGDIDEEELRTILGYNYSEETGRERPSITTYFRLVVNIDDETIEGDGPYLNYLREISQLPHVPGNIFTRLGKEVFIRHGRWAGEAEAMQHFERAAAMGDPEGMRLLANRLIRYRDDPAQVNRAVNLLTRAVQQYGLMEAMDDLDALYRCQVNEAPRLTEADYWAENYRATQHETPYINPNDLVAMGRFREPEMLGLIQSQALTRRIQATAYYLERLQRSEAATQRADALWARWANRSDQTLEAFAELEFALAESPVVRDRAVEFFRRVYLNNGVTTALDLAIALVEHNGRDEDIAVEIIELLNKASHRGEGASIRLMSRLLADVRSEEEIYAEFADIIEDRGDFLALMFAIPHLPPEKLDDYIDRAVSLMNCGTKDSDELGDAYAIWRLPELSYHWRNIGLHFEGGHTLSRLRLTNEQMEMYAEGRAPDAVTVTERALAEGESIAAFELYQLLANPDLESYDPQKAAQVYLDIVALNNPDDLTWLIESFRLSSDEIRSEIEILYDITRIFETAIDRGDSQMRFEYAMVLRERARSAQELTESIDLLRTAAINGSVSAMREYGRVLGYGLGVPRDSSEAALWLSQADEMGDPQALEILRLLTLQIEAAE